MHLKISSVKRWPFCPHRDELTHCALVTPYGDVDLGQHWLSHYLNQCWLIITKVQWCSSDSNSSVTKSSLKMILLRFYWNLPGANELIVLASAWTGCHPEVAQSDCRPNEAWAVTSLPQPPSTTDQHGWSHTIFSEWPIRRKKMELDDWKITLFLSHSHRPVMKFEI